MDTTKTNDMRASAEYANRPKDEIYPSLQAWADAATYDRDHSKEARYNFRDLQVTTSRQNGPPRIVLQSPKAQAEFTNWSYTQLCRSVGAPSGYLASLPIENAANDLTYGLQQADRTAGKRCNILVKQNGGPLIVRAATSDTYGRAWDAELAAPLLTHFGDGVRASEGGTWQSPATWSGEGAGQYRGDRNSFVIRIDGGSIVGDPRGWSGGGNGRLNRAVMLSNSEVGDRSITIETLLFDFICGNHILWGAVLDGKKFRRRHVGPNAAQDAISELLRIARRYNERTASEDEKIIRSLVTHEIAHTREAVIDEMIKIGFTKQAAADAYDTAEAKEPNLNPRSFWGAAAGVTRLSQESGHQDTREKLDTLGALLLAKGRQLVTV